MTCKKCKGWGVIWLKAGIPNKIKHCTCKLGKKMKKYRDLKRKGTYLYDTRDHDEAVLTKFVPIEKRSYYADRQEIFTNFQKAKQAVMDVLTAELDALEARIHEVQAMTPETCPEGDDPYC